MSRLHGEFHHKLDAKGRLSLPSAFRKSLTSDMLVLTPSPRNDCLYAFEPSDFDNWIVALFEKDGGFSASNERHVALRKALNARAFDVEIDASGRIGLASSVREKLGMQREVVVVGDSDHFEIWNAQDWEQFALNIDLGELFF